MRNTKRERVKDREKEPRGKRDTEKDSDEDKERKRKMYCGLWWCGAKGISHFSSLTKKLRDRLIELMMV